MDKKMDKNMDNSIVYWDYIDIMEKKMEPTIVHLIQEYWAPWELRDS